MKCERCGHEPPPETDRGCHPTAFYITRVCPDLGEWVKLSAYPLWRRVEDARAWAATKLPKPPWYVVGVSGIDISVLDEHPDPVVRVGKRLARVAFHALAGCVESWERQ